MVRPHRNLWGRFLVSFVILKPSSLFSLGQTCKALFAFQLKVDKLRKAVDASSEVLDEDKKRLSFIKSAFKSYPNLDLKYLRNLEELNSNRDDIQIQLYGDPSLSKRDIEQKESIASKVGIIIWNMWRSRSSTSSTNKMLYESASLDFEKVIEQMQLLDNSLKEIEKYLESKEVPFTPGRGLILNWKKE